MAVLKYKDKDGNWVGIPTIRGENGHTPVRGTDYWTLTDKTEIINEVSNKAVLKSQDVSNVGKILVVGADGNITFADMPTGGGTDADIIGTIDGNNTIVLSSELALADGTYVFKYENADGSYLNIGTLIIGGVVEYAITATLTNCVEVVGNPKTIKPDGTATLTYKADSGYELPEEITVIGAGHTWDATAGTVTLSNPTGDVTIIVVAIEAEQPIYSITTSLINCVAASGNATTIQNPQEVTLTFTASEGYVLPDNITITNASSYNWDKETGKLTISKATGNVVITIEAVEPPPYTNVLPLAQQYASTSPYVDATTGAIGYGESKRLSSSSQSATYMKAIGTTDANVDTTGLIPVKRGDIIRLKNCNFKVTPANQTYGTYINGFKADKSLAAGFNLSASNITVRVPTVVENGEYTQITLEPLEAYASSNIDSVAYIMISTDDLNENSIITINEEITE